MRHISNDVYAKRFASRSLNYKKYTNPLKHLCNSKVDPKLLSNGFYDKIKNLEITKYSPSMENKSRNEGLKMIFADDSIFDYAFNIRNTQIETLSEYDNQFCIFPNKSYINPKLTKRKIYIPDKSGSNKFSQSFYIKKAKLIIESVPKDKFSQSNEKRNTKCNWMNIRRLLARKIGKNESMNLEEKKNIWNKLIINSHKKAIIRKARFICNPNKTCNSF